MASFSWLGNPEIADFVFNNYAGKGSIDLARMVQERWNVSLPPGAIRDYCRHRRNREKLADEGVDLPIRPEEVRAEVAGPDSPWADKRPDLTEADAAELFHWAMEEVERKEARSTAQTHLTCQRHKDVALPVAVCYWSDWQIGTNGVMMRQLEQDAEAIRDTEGLFTFPMGDLIQNLNQRKHPSSLHNCVLPDPREQEIAARYVLDLVRPKIEGIVDGNHEMNTQQASGFTLGDRWAKELSVPYLWHGGLVNYHVGQIEYKLGLRHKFTNESNLNTTNVQRTMSMLWPDADVIVLGHRHYNDCQMIKRPLKEQVWLRAGSYQKWDDFGMSIGHYRGQWGLPLTILFPDQRTVMPIYGAHFYAGLRLLRFWRDEYAAGRTLSGGGHGGKKEH
jgi:hypothetical protein